MTALPLIVPDDDTTAELLALALALAAALGALSDAVRQVTGGLS